MIRIWLIYMELATPASKKNSFELGAFDDADKWLARFKPTEPVYTVNIDENVQN